MGPQRTHEDAVIRKHVNLIDDPGLLADPSGTWNELREEAAAIHTDIPVPAWVLTRHEDIRDAFQQHELFSSRRVTAYYEPPEVADFRGMVGRLIPEELDPPEHTAFRQILTPLLSPHRVAELEPMIRDQCVSLIEGLVDRSGCDFVRDFARQFPGRVFMRLFGLPVEQADTFLGWADDLMHTLPGGDPDGHRTSHPRRTSKPRRKETPMPGEDWTIISVDDHVLEPPETWRTRLPAKHRERGPRVVSDNQGEAWVYEGRRMPTVGLEVAAALDWPADTYQWDPVPYAEMPPGAYDPLARVQDMDRDGVLASVLFPSQFTGFCGSAFFQGSDRDLSLLCVQAWNDFMIDEWCAAAPGRFIPQIILPLWDVPACVREIERTAGKGARSIAFCENPSRHGFASIFSSERAWDPVFAAAQDTGMLLNMHIGSSSFIPLTAGDAPLSVMISIASYNAIYSCTDWLLSDNLERFPDLRITWAEGGIGWIPTVLDRLDFVWERHQWLPARLEHPPSYYYRRQAFGCCYADEVANSDIERIGVDHILLEVDYPHSDSTFPGTPDATKRGLGGLPATDIEWIARGNAERLFNFTPSGIGQL